MIILRLLVASHVMVAFDSFIATNDVAETFISDFRLLDEESLDITNKTISSRSTTVRNYISSKYEKLPHEPKYLPTLPPGNREILFHSSYTPPVPPQWLNVPFADKPTLRGSNSDPSSASNRRPIPPPHIKFEKERIPVKPPDLGASDSKKKTINTPSFQKIPEFINYNEPGSSTSSTTHRINNTFDSVIPNVQNISVNSIFRLLDNDKKPDFPRYEPPFKNPPSINNNNNEEAKPSSTTKPFVSHVTIKSTDEDRFEFSVPSYSIPYSEDDLAPPPQNKDSLFKDPLREDKFNTFVPSKTKKDPTDVADRPESQSKKRLGFAWEAHVYLIAILFSILAGMSIFTLFRIRAYKWLLPSPYFVVVHSLLTIIGIVRSGYLFYDPYNIGKSFSEPVSRLLLNVAFPLLILLFAIMFLYVLKTVDVKTGLYYVQKTYVLLVFTALYFLFSVGVSLYANETSHPSKLIFVSQCVFILLCVVLGVTYIYLFRTISQVTLRKPNSIYSSSYIEPLRSSLTNLTRAMLATSLLSLLMAVMYLIGMFCIYEPFGKERPQSLMFWAFQLSLRVIEVSSCFLLFWAAAQRLRKDLEKETQSHNSACQFALFPWSNSVATTDNDNPDDIYPTLCRTSQRFHNYAARNKPVYEDIYPLRTMHVEHHNAIQHAPPHLCANNTLDRRSMRRYPPDGEISQSSNSMYEEKRLHPAHSMLVNENGKVRFRSFADAEPIPDEPFSHDSFSPSQLSNSNEEYSI